MGSPLQYKPSPRRTAWNWPKPLYIYLSHIYKGLVVYIGSYCAGFNIPFDLICYYIGVIDSPISNIKLSLPVDLDKIRLRENIPAG